jgi:Uncharacterized protein conserved in bacteria (DUF2344)
MPAQRWRLIVSRSDDAANLAQREQIAAWDAMLEASGFTEPTVTDRARLVPGAPIPVGLTASREPFDLFLPERRTAAEVRSRLEPQFPVGHRLVDMYDVWLGEPPLPGVVVAGDYLVEIAALPASAGDAMVPPPRPAIRAAVEAFLAASTIERARSRPDRPGAGNLRSLVMDIQQPSDSHLWMRLRFDPVLGTGRPEEVVAALGTLAGLPLVPVRRHRERIWLKGEMMTPPEPPQAPPSS